MTLIDRLTSIFNVDKDSIYIKESLYNAEILINASESLIVKGEYFLLIKKIFDDDFQTDLLYCNSSEKTLGKYCTLSEACEFAQALNGKLEDLDYTNPDDKLFISSFQIRVYIRKQVREQILNIYDFTSLCKYWDNLSWKDRLAALANHEFKKGIVFYLRFDTIHCFMTESFYFTNNLKIKPQFNNYIEDIRENVYWSNIDSYPFSPIQFHLIERPNVDNSFTKSFDILSVVFSLCTLFDITSLNESGSVLNFKLCGYKNVTGQFELNKAAAISVHTELEYYNIFKWIYVGEGNKSDKISIARNILSLFVTNANVNIEENVFLSIKSSFKTYLKENLDRYVSIRNQIYQELDSIIALSSLAKREFLTGFKNNLLACITFFFSTLVIEVLGEASQKTILFSREIVLLSYAIFLISFLYMFWMRRDIDTEKDNISKRYTILKDRYSDLLIPEEIDTIFRHGIELEDQLRYINEFKKRYSFLWGISLFILFLVVTFLSDFYNLICVFFI